MVQTGAMRSTDLHRVFLQSMLSRRVMPEEVLVELYKRALGACQSVDDEFRPTHQGDKQGARSFVKDINKILDQSGMQMEMRSVKDEENMGRDMWALVNVDPAEEASMMTDYEPLQITYFRVIANAIITSYPANSVGSNQALSLVSSLPAAMTKAAADGLLTSFVGRGWLFKSKRGRFSLGPRAILELDNWLASEHEDMIQKCARCHKTVLTGIICGNIECDAHIHKTCYSILMTAPRPKCTACSTEFGQIDVKPLGEKSVKRTEDHYNQMKGKRKRPSTAAKGKGRATAGAGEDADEDDEEDFEEEEGDGGDGTDTGEVEEEDGNPDKSSGVLAGNGPARWKVASNRSRTRKGTVIPDSGDEEEEEEEEDEDEEAPRTRRKR